MTETNKLSAALRAPNEGASFIASRYAGLVTIEPQTAAAGAWLHAYADSEASWANDALVVELRYFPGLADSAIAEGFTFERDALPN